MTTLQEDRAFVEKLATIMIQAQSAARGQVQPNAFNSRYKETALSSPLVDSMYGRNSIFDPCEAGDIWGLQVETNGLMNWLGWMPNRYASRRVTFIQWWGPEGTAAGSASTLAGAPCDDPDTWEYGDCGYELCHDSWYQVGGETLDPHTLSLDNRCETSPRYRLNGVQIQDDMEWQANGMLNVLNQAIQYGVVHGSHTNAYEMEGLNGRVRGGYLDKNGQPCPAVDSILVDWQNDDLDGAVNGFGNFFDYVDEIVDEIEYRAQNLGGISERDMVLVTSRSTAKELLNKFACYSACGLTTGLSDISDQAIRNQVLVNRQNLNGGPLYDGTRAVGYISLKGGRRLPIIVHDTLTLSTSGGNYCSDIFLLTRQIGNRDVFRGMYMDLRIAARAYARRTRAMKIHSDAVGRFLMSHKVDNFCTQLIMGTSPELYLAAPWAQVRFEDVCVDKARKPIVGDPYQPDYHFTEGALYPAEAWDRDCDDTAAEEAADAALPRS
jgi:hypothetical protein